MIIDNAPLFDLLQGSKAAETGEVIVQTAISDARRLRGAVGITHLRRAKKCEISNLITPAKGNPGAHHKDGRTTPRRKLLGPAWIAPDERKHRYCFSPRASWLAASPMPPSELRPNSTAYYPFHGIYISIDLHASRFGLHIPSSTVVELNGKTIDINGLIGTAPFRVTPELEAASHASVGAGYAPAQFMQPPPFDLRP